jgi:DNA-binding IclR family transcriptional regulator
MAIATESNKAKIARRVVEVLDYFDDEHPHATVMDIVRRYNRPQSSTSELLSSLVELGLLYKDPFSRSYTLTPRAAMLGATAQPDIIRSGSVTALVDRLVAQTGLSVAVFGMVGLNVQIFLHKSGKRGIATSNPKGISCGLQDQLSNSAAGRLLLSTIGQPRRDGIVRRLNAEANDEHKFSTTDMTQFLEVCRQTGSAHAGAGFGTVADSCCVLLPGQPEHQPIVFGFIYEPNAQTDPALLILCLQDAVKRMLYGPTVDDETPVQLLSSAA